MSHGDLDVFKLLQVTSSEHWNVVFGLESNGFISLLVDRLWIESNRDSIQYYPLD